MSVLIIDNYDSFVYNLVRYTHELGHQSWVYRNDAITLNEIKNLAPQYILLSPGPNAPNEAGICLDLLKELPDIAPILGVCLGHQAIAQAFGAQIIRAKQPMHGKPCAITHTGVSLFRELPNPLTVGRYHSLIADKDSLPSALKITAEDKVGQIMAIEHESLPIFGVQFHPESILTEGGHQLLRNFFELRL